MPDASANSQIGTALAQSAQQLAENRLPPVHDWNPAHCGHSEMRIDPDGRWFHRGGEIRRAALVRLFSTVLRREDDGRYVLVTPVEKFDIDVEDAPFLATAMTTRGTGKTRTLRFELNIGDEITADAERQIFLAEKDGDARPYVHVRSGLNARLSRPVYYALADLAIGEAACPPGLWSAGTFFDLSAASA